MGNKGKESSNYTIVLIALSYSTSSGTILS